MDAARVLLLLAATCAAPRASAASVSPRLDSLGPPTVVTSSVVSVASGPSAPRARWAPSPPPPSWAPTPSPSWAPTPSPSWTPTPSPAPSVHAVLSVSVAPASAATSTPAPAVVCVGGATGCRTQVVSSSVVVTGNYGTTNDDDDDDDELTEKKPKVFFVDEDSAEADQTKEHKDKKKTKKVPDVPVVVGYAGWKGKDMDDFPVRPFPSYDPFDREHTFPPGPWRVVHANAVHGPFHDARFGGSEPTVVVRHVLRATPPFKTLATRSANRYPQPIPYSPGGYWGSRGSGGGYPSGGGYYGSRPVSGPKRPYPVPGFYGGAPPSIYSRGDCGPPSWRPPSGGGGGGGGDWSRPTTTTKPVGVKDRVDFGDGDDAGGDDDEPVKPHDDDGDHTVVEVDGKIDLEDFKR